MGGIPYEGMWKRYWGSNEMLHKLGDLLRDHLYLIQEISQKDLEASYEFLEAYRFFISIYVCSKITRCFIKKFNHFVACHAHGGPLLVRWPHIYFRAYPIWLIIFAMYIFHFISICHMRHDVSMIPLKHSFWWAPFYLTFLLSCFCEWISLDPYLHDQHNHNINAYRPIDLSIPSWLPMWVDLIGSLLAWLTYNKWIDQWYHT